MMLSFERGPTAPAVERGVGIWTKVEFSGQERGGREGAAREAARMHLPQKGREHMLRTSGPMGGS